MEINVEMFLKLVVFECYLWKDHMFSLVVWYMQLLVKAGTCAEWKGYEHQYRNTVPWQNTQRPVETFSAHNIHGIEHSFYARQPLSSAYSWPITNRAWSRRPCRAQSRKWSTAAS